MDKLTLITGITGIVLFVISIAIIISAIVKLVKKKITFKNFIAPFLKIFDYLSYLNFAYTSYSISFVLQKFYL